MKLGYVILYVPDVAASVAFYEKAFGLARRFVHESGEYAEMETGGTALAFASETVAKENGVVFRLSRSNDDAPAVEIALTTDDPNAAFARAIEAGATSVRAPAVKPWGQTVGYVRDANGFVVELCTPMG
jgi:lactoylglutathione lyase